MLGHVTIRGKQYRRGYTTGSCAAAAAKASVLMLVHQKPLSTIEIDTPSGIRLTCSLHEPHLEKELAFCAVVKDGGDDPDTTHGLKIYAKATFTESTDIQIETGEGIGIVTQKGLKVPVGEPAINPVPRQMILKEVGEVLPPNRGVKLFFWVPNGEEVAKETYNPRLGIVGGISILGTKGIVEPMSEEAYRESLLMQLSVLREKGETKAVLVFGNYGADDMKKKFAIADHYFITMSNFVGAMLTYAADLGFTHLLLAGHIGKMVKVAGGIFHTHSHVADARMELLAAFSALHGADAHLVKEIMAQKTTEGALLLLEEETREAVLTTIAKRASARAQQHVFGKLTVGCVILSDFGNDYRVEEIANKLLEEFS